MPEPERDAKLPKHHFVPAFYLRGWSDPQTHNLVMYVPDVRAPDRIGKKERGARGLGYIRGLYTIDSSNNPNMIESDFFQEIDNQGAEVLSLLQRADPPPLMRSQRLAWAKFLISLLERHPVRIEERTKQCTEILRAELAKKDIHVMTSEAEKVLAAKARETALQWPLKQIIQHPENQERIADLPWAVLPFEPGVIITSARPLLLGDDHASPEEYWAMISIGPSHVFVAGNERHHSKAAEYNHRLYSQEPEWIASSRVLDEENMLLARSYLGNKWEWKPAT